MLGAGGVTAAGGGGGGPITRDALVTYNSTTQGSSHAVSVTTTQTNDFLVLVVGLQSSSLGDTVSSVTGGGLTWTKVKEVSSAALVNAGNGNSAEVCSVWISSLASSVLTAQSITANFTLGNAYTMVLTAWHGVNTTTPLDTNAGNPFFLDNNTTTSNIPTVTGVSTTNANTVIIAAYTSQNFAGSNRTAGTGYTLDFGTNNANSFANEVTPVEHKIVTSAQSSVSVPFNSADSDWHMIVIALQQAP